MFVILGTWVDGGMVCLSSCVDGGHYQTVIFQKFVP